MHFKKGFNMLQQPFKLAKEVDINSSKKELTLKLVKNDENLIKSKERVQHHGEVFTPNWMVKKMLSEPSIQEKVHDLHATFLEPSAGEGAFLTEILHQKLEFVNKISNKTTWKDNAIWALMSIYGIELLPDNITKAKQLMLDIVKLHYQQFFTQMLSSRSNFYKAARFVIATNIVQGNALTYKNNAGNLITFSDWQVIDDKHVKREDFTYKSMFDDSDEETGAAQQLDLFSFNAKSTKAPEYAVCPVLKVYKEEKDD